MIFPVHRLQRDVLYNQQFRIMSAKPSPSWWLRNNLFSSNSRKKLHIYYSCRVIVSRKHVSGIPRGWLQRIKRLSRDNAYFL